MIKINELIANKLKKQKKAKMKMGSVKIVKKMAKTKE